MVEEEERGGGGGGGGRATLDADDGDTDGSVDEADENGTGGISEDDALEWFR